MDCSYIRFSLDSRADAFIKPHTMLATQFLTEPDAKGYIATSVGVGASLGRQGRVCDDFQTGEIGEKF